MSTTAKTRLSESTQRLLSCPVCKVPLAADDGNFQCTNLSSTHCFPIVDGIPILINEAGSLFSIDDIRQGRSTTYGSRRISRIKLFIADHLPELGSNVKSKGNCRQFFELILGQTSNPLLLVIGGGISGKSFGDQILDNSIEQVQTDVVLSPHIAVALDAHDIPFTDCSFDGVIIPAVLEHVLDPYRCVDEIHRVLKEGGLVYAETAFMQQVHGGRYDFTRFTHLGHRRLFRKFEEIYHGAVTGPGTALAWSYLYFLYSFANRRRQRSWMQLVARATGFWCKYFDSHLIDKPGTLDAAGAYGFLGRKSHRVLSDRELIELYRGSVGQFVVAER